MQFLKVLSRCGILLLICGISSAQADGWHGGHGGHGGHDGHGHIGVVIGVPGPWYPYGGYYPGGYYYPYASPYYYPPAYAVPSGPTTYTEQSAPAPESGDNYWYYCADSKAYYPYAKQCPGGWTRVAPTPDTY
jgi:hypothetical protein